jgi:predicted phage tail protein
MSAQLNVHRIVNPFEPTQVTRQQWHFDPTRPIIDLFPLGQHHAVVVSINGKIVEETDFALTYAQPGDHMVICPIPEGGGSGGRKTVLRLVAMIAVAVVAPYLGPVIAGGLGFATVGFAASAFTLGVTVAGSLLINALLPPPKPSNTNKDAFESAPSYGIDGAKNTITEGVPVPVAYGKFRQGGNIVDYYTRNDGNTQYVHALIAASEGQIAGIKDIEINDLSPDKFPIVETEIRTGINNQPRIEWFNQTVVPQSVGSELTNPAYTFYTTSGEVDKFRIDFVLPGGLAFINSQTGSNQQFSVEIEIGYRRVGTTDWIPFGNPASITGYATKYQYSYVDGAGTSISELRDTLIAGDTVVDNAIIRTVSGYQVAVGTVVNNPIYAAGNYFITDSTSSAVRRSVESPVLAEGQYEIRIRRNPKDMRPEALNTLYVADINEITIDPVNYNYTALLGVRVRLGEQISGLPKITFINEGRIIKVWTSMNEFIYAPSSNPAWIAWDILTNSRFGGGISESRLDKRKWLEWGQFCFANGLEFNGIFENQSNVWDGLQQVFRVGRAQIVPMGTRYTVAIERAEDPVMVFNVANIVEGSFKQSWLDMSSRANEIDVTYFNKENGYKQETVKVSNILQSPNEPQRSSSITLFGVVDKDAAYREGELQLALNKYVTQSVMFSAPTDAIACTVGNVILIQHDMPQWGYGGRLESGSTRSIINVDRPMHFEPASSYALLVQYDSLVRGHGDITSYAGLDLSVASTWTGTVQRALVHTQNFVRFGRTPTNAYVEGYGGAGKPSTLTTGIANADGRLSAFRAVTNANYQGLVFKREGGKLLGIPYTVRFSARCASGTVTLAVGMDDGTSQDITLTTSWQVFERTITPTSSAIDQIERVLQIVEPTTSGIAWEIDNPVSQIVGSEPADVEIVEVQPQSGFTVVTIAESIPGVYAGVLVEAVATDAIIERNVVNPGFSTDLEALTLTAPLPQAPGRYTKFLFGPVNKTSKPFRVTSIRGSQDYVRDIEAIEYNASIYSGAGFAPNPNVSDLPLTAQHVVILGCSEEVYKSGTGLTTRVTVSWRGNEDGYMNARVYLSRNGSPSELLSDRARDRWTVEAASGDTLVWKIVARNALGFVAPEATAPTFTYVVLAETSPPANVTGLTATAYPYGIELKWNQVATLNLSHYEIRVGPDFNTATVISRVAADTFLYKMSAFGTYKFWVRAIDRDGRASVTPAQTTLTLAGPTIDSVTSEFVTDRIKLTWTATQGNFAIDRFEVRQGPVYAVSTLLLSGKTNTHEVKADFSGTKTYWIVGIDVAGNYGDPVSYVPTVLAPNQPTVNAFVVDNTARLSWNDVRRSLPIEKYEIRRGVSYLTATVLGYVNALFASLTEENAGTYTYWVTGIDTAGNAGTPGSVTVELSIGSSSDYVDLTYTTEYPSYASGFAVPNHFAFGKINGYGPEDEIRGSRLNMWTGTFHLAGTALLQIPDTADFSFEVTQVVFNRPATASPIGSIGMMYRTNYFNNVAWGFGYIVLAKPDGSVFLHRGTNDGTDGSYVTIASAGPVAGCGPNVEMIMKVEVRGSLHKVWINGVLQISHTDATYNTSSKIALVSYDFENNGGPDSAQFTRWVAKVPMYFSRFGGVIDGQVIINGMKSPTDPSMVLRHAQDDTSRRAMIQFDNWWMGQDSAANGTKNFALYDFANAYLPIEFLPAPSLIKLKRNRLNIGRLGTTDDGAGGKITFNRSVDDTEYAAISVVGAGASPDLQFEVNEAVRMTIFDNGDVNIGSDTAAPGYRLRVQGTANITGNTVVDGFLTVSSQIGSTQPNIVLGESSAAPSNRASIRFGTKWTLGQDHLTDGERNFFLNDGVAGYNPIVFSENPDVIQISRNKLLLKRLATSDDGQGGYLGFARSFNDTEWASIRVNGTAALARLETWVNGSLRSSYFPSGNLNIGNSTTDPGFRLNVQGTINATTAVSADTATFNSATIAGKSTFVNSISGRQGDLALVAGTGVTIDNTTDPTQFVISAVDTSAVPNTRQIIAGTGLTGGGNLTVDRTLSVVDDTTNQRLKVSQAGTLKGTRPEVNFVAGTNVILTIADDGANNRVNMTIDVDTGVSGYYLPLSGVDPMEGRLTLFDRNAINELEAVSKRYVDGRVGRYRFSRNWDDSVITGQSGLSQSTYLVHGVTAGKFYLRSTDGGGLPTSQWAYSRFDSIMPMADFDMSVEIRLPTDDKEVGFAYRTPRATWSTGASSFFYGAVIRSDGSQARLALRQGASEIDNVVLPGTIIGGSTITLRVVTSRERHDIFVNGNLYLTVTDTYSLTPGFLGFFTNSGDTAVCFDNFSIQGSNVLPVNGGTLWGALVVRGDPINRFGYANYEAGYVALNPGSAANVSYQGAPGNLAFHVADGTRVGYIGNDFGGYALEFKLENSWSGRFWGGTWSFFSTLNIASGVKLTGDFSNGTRASRTLLQSVSGNSYVGVVPAVSSTNSEWNAYNSSNPDNAAALTTGIDTTKAYIQVAAYGTGTLVPLEFYFGATRVGKWHTNGNLNLGPDPSDPGVKLNIEGSVNITGDLTIGGNYPGSGTSGSPGGSNRAVQFNDGSVFGGAGGAEIDTNGDLVIKSFIHMGYTTPTAALMLWNTSGNGAPTTGTRSAGSKLVLYPALSGSTVDTAIGVSSQSMWFSVPSNSYNYQWYLGATSVMTLSNGSLSLTGSFSASSTGSFSGSLSVGSSISAYGQFTLNPVSGQDTVIQFFGPSNSDYRGLRFYDVSSYQAFNLFYERNTGYFGLRRHNATGVYQERPFFVNRADGIMRFENRISIEKVAASGNDAEIDLVSGNAANARYWNVRALGADGTLEVRIFDDNRIDNHLSILTITRAGVADFVQGNAKMAGRNIQRGLQFQQGGSNQGSVGGVETVNFTGTGVAVSHSSGVLTVDISAATGGVSPGGSAGAIQFNASGGFGGANFANIDTDGNISIETGGKIRGDFSNGTIANRVVFQTSLADERTMVGAKPAGTNRIAGFIAHNKDDVDNAAALEMSLDTTYAYIRVSATGSESVPVLVYRAGSTTTASMFSNGNWNFGPTITDPGYRVNVEGTIRATTLRLGSTNYSEGGIITTGGGQTISGTLTVAGLTSSNGLTVNSGNSTFAGSLVDMSGSGARFVADWNSATISSRAAFRTRNANQSTSVLATPNGTGAQAGFFASNNSTPADSAYLAIYANQTVTALESGIYGSGAYLPLGFNTGNVRRMTIHTDGNINVGPTTTNPGVTFNVEGTVNATFVKVNGVDITAGQQMIQFQNQGGNMGATGTVDTVDFVGSGVTSSRVGNKVTVTVAGATNPGGSNTQVQFNDSGLLGGDPDFTWNKTTNVLTIAGGLSVTGSAGNRENISLTAGSSAGSGNNGGAITIASGANTGVSGRGGHVNITSGAGNAGGAGSIILTVGVAASGGTNGEFIVNVDGVDVFKVDGKRNVVMGFSALSTSATDGFVYIPSTAGTPTGTPTNYVGRVPLVIDSTTNRLYLYAGGTWNQISGGGGGGGGSGGFYYGPTEPASPVPGDRWVDSTTATLYTYIDDGSSEQWVDFSGGGGGGGAGTSKVTQQDYALGTQAGNQSDYTYYTVPSICARGLVSKFVITADAIGNFDLVVRGAASGSGETHLEVEGYQYAVYTMTVPFYYENDAAAQGFVIGIKNRSAVSRTFELTSLRVEKFA